MTFTKTILAGLALPALLVSGVANAAETRAAQAIPPQTGVQAHALKVSRRAGAVDGSTSASLAVPIVAGIAGGAGITALCFAVGICGKCDSTGG